MTILTRENAVKILSILKEAYPNLGKADPVTTAKVWATALRDADYASCNRGLLDLIQHETFPPNPAILLKYAEKHKYTGMDVLCWKTMLDEGWMDRETFERNLSQYLSQNGEEGRKYLKSIGEEEYAERKLSSGDRAMPILPVG